MWPRGTAPRPCAPPEATPSGTTPSTIDIRGLERRYGERPALAGVHLELAEGSTLGVFGSNGAGKTTLLRVLAGLLRPHSGAISVLGAELPKEAWRLRGQIGYLGHEPLLYRELSVRQNLRFQARLHGVEAARVDQMIEGVGLGSRADEPLRDLSRGMIQRAAAARAVLPDPPLLLLDEPRAGLDPAAAELLEPLIGRASGRTRVLVTHDVEGGLAESDQVLGLRAGRQELFEPAGSVTAATLRELYS